MDDFLSGVLNLFGMFVDPSAGKRFQGIHVTGQVVNNPGWQLGARVGEDMVCFVQERLSISCIALEESEYSEG